MYERHKYSDDPNKLSSIENPVATKKYDGGNYFLKFDGEGKPSFVSRRESVKGGVLDKTSKVPHLAEIRIPEFKDHVINVELVHTGQHKDNQESHPLVSGILNSLPPRAIQQQELHGPIRAVMFDIVSPHINTYKEKLELLKRIEVAAQKPDVLFVPEAKIGMEAITRFIATTKHHGDEGVIVTDLEKPEAENLRVKVVHRKMANLRIVDFVQEVDKNGNAKDSTGSYVVADSTGRIVGSVGSGITREERIQSWKNKPGYKGKLVQVKFKTITGNGMLREPTYNGEADGDCDKI